MGDVRLGNQIEQLQNTFTCAVLGLRRCTKGYEEMRHPTENLSWGIIELQVTNLARAVDFWTDAIGLHIRSQDKAKAELGTPNKTLIILHAGATRPVGRAFLGMYHVAIGMPDQAEFSRVLARLITKNITISPTDHLASKSIYFSDPDGLEIEIIFETPERFSHMADPSKGLMMYDVDGNPHSGREALDVPAELSHAAGADVEAMLGDGSFLAHMHFKVSTLEDGQVWFEGLGFQRNLLIPSFGFADMSAGGTTTHRLAMNVWSGPGLSGAPAGMARLVRYTLHAHDAELLARVQGLTPAGDGLAGVDPAGVDVKMLPAA